MVVDRLVVEKSALKNGNISGAALYKSVQKNVCVPLFTNIKASLDREATQFNLQTLQLRWTAKSRNLIVILFTHKGGELSLGGLFCPFSFPFITAAKEPVLYKCV